MPGMFPEWGGGGGDGSDTWEWRSGCIGPPCTTSVWVLILSLPSHVLPSLTQSRQEKPYLTSYFILEPELDKTPDFTYHPRGSVVLEYSMEEGRMNGYIQVQRGGHKMVAHNFNSGAICVLLNLFGPKWSWGLDLWVLKTCVARQFRQCIPACWLQSEIFSYWPWSPSLPIAQCSGELGPFILCLAHMSTEACVPLANSSQEHGDLFRMTPNICIFLSRHQHWQFGNFYLLFFFTVWRWLLLK